MPLCKRGIEAARKKFAVYPSAYANGYAVQVCLGRVKDASGRRAVDSTYAKQYSAKRSQRSRSRSRVKGGASNLRRWFEEEWIDVCRSKFDSKGRVTHKVSCGRSKAKGKKSEYPYCRPLRKRSRDTPRTAGSLSRSKRAQMCARKHRSPERRIRLDD